MITRFGARGVPWCLPTSRNTPPTGLEVRVLAVTAQEFVETCARLDRDHRQWVLAGRPSVETRYSGIVTWALGMSWRDWYLQARDWFLEVYPVFADGVGHRIVAPEYTSEEIRNAQDLMYLGVKAARLLDDINQDDGTERRLGAMFDTMCQRQGGRLI
jgi:hypothetical protein